MESKNYKKVENYYKKGLWDINKVLNAVGKWITAEEYKDITSFIYPNKEDNNNE